MKFRELLINEHIKVLVTCPERAWKLHDHLLLYLSHWAAPEALGLELKKRGLTGTSLVAQGLRLRAPNAGAQV